MASFASPSFRVLLPRFAFAEIEARASHTSDVPIAATTTGYALYWQLTKLGIPCVVIASTLVPTKAGIE